MGAERYDSVNIGMSGSSSIFVLQLEEDRRDRMVKIEYDEKTKSPSEQEDPFYDAINQLHLQNAIRQLESGNGTVHELIDDTDS